MALLPYTVTAIRTVDGVGDINIVKDAPIIISNSDGPILISEDKNGTNSEYSKLTDANGQFVCWIPAGSYTLNVDGNITYFALGSNSNTENPDVITSSFTVTSSDSNKLLIIRTTADIIITAGPADVGTSISFMQDTTYEVLFQAASGQTIISPLGLNPYTQYSVVNLTNIGDDTWLLSGDLG